MTRLRDSGDGPKRGPGRRPRDPKLLPPGVDYAGDWRDMHKPALAGLLVELERGAAEWEAYVGRWKAYECAYSEGLDPSPPPPPSDVAYFWGLLRETAHMPADQRPDLVATLQNRRRPVPTPVRGREISTHDVVEWLRGEALAHGIAAGLATPYQAWLVLAELVLRDVDIGTIASEVHADRLERKTNVQGGEKRTLDSALIRDRRRIVKSKRKAFGY